jgi:hypothetical protein
MNWKSAINRVQGFVLVTSLFMAHYAMGQEKPMDRAEQVRFFENRIRPVLVKECYGCHSQQSGKVRGGLFVDSKKGLEDGGDSGAAIVPGELDESNLWSAINHQDWNMPPNGKLSDEVIEDFRQWILMGAPDPRTTKKEKINTTITIADIREGRNFWSFKKPVAVQPPEIPDADWAKSEIDKFVLQKLQEKNLSPSADADPQTLLRRLTFDLVGLPPTPEQISWFATQWEKDQDQAVAHVVDSLLQNEQFGERWGRHWLDVARYGESSGKELNATFPHAWRYRDYVIDSFNQDKPYDQFVREQIAGDLLPAKTDEDWTENLIATGFLAIGTKTLTEQNPRQFLADLADEQIDVTTRVFLGLSVACARCHDHKFDPIPQSDYYALAGIFMSTNTYYGTIDTRQNRRSSALLELPVKDIDPNQKPLTQDQREKLNEQLTSLRQEYAEVLKARRERRTNSNENAERNAIFNIARISSQIGVVESILESYDKNGNPMSFCMGVQDSGQPRDVPLLVRGELNQPAQVVERGFVQVIRNNPTKIKPDSSGRLEFAKWVSSNDNPLTARVMANRVWLHLLGQGIVRSPEDFGSTGMAPTHPELLDYLAKQFVSNGWSVKKLVREIATSRVYRISSTYHPEMFERDPENEYFWRANSRRLDAESLRDAILCASGEIDYQRPRGSLVSKAGETVARDGTLVRNSVESTMQDRRAGRPGANARNAVSIDQADMHRSVYLPIVRDDLPRALAAFDFAEPSMVIGQREQSNTPSQGLYFMNNEFVIDQCDAMAERLLESSSDQDSQIQQAFVLVYGREPTAKEKELSKDFLNSFESATRRSRRPTANLSAFCQALFASAEFRYRD